MAYKFLWSFLEAIEFRGFLKKSKRRKKNPEKPKIKKNFKNNGARMFLCEMEKVLKKLDIHQSWKAMVSCSTLRVKHEGLGR